MKQRVDGILQHGETTGHFHQVIDGNVYEEDDGEVWFAVNTDTKVIHQEHHTIEIYPVIQEEATRRIVVEYDHFKEEARQVRD